MNKTSPQTTVEVIIHQINQPEITILCQAIISNIIHKEIILHHQFIKMKVNDKTFRDNSIKIIRGVGTRIEDGMIEGGIMVMELIQIEEIMVMEEVEMLIVKTGEEILDKAQMGIKIIDPLWGTNRH